MNPDTLKPNIVVICGPTGIGKTTAGIEAAGVYNGEIISADSMQIYRYMDIGTAKPTPEEQARIPHHLIDILDPDEPFDAAKFAQMAREKIMAFHKQNILPFIVGGTGFYIKALEYGLFSDAPSDMGIRTRLKEEAAAKGIRFLYNRLRGYDPDTAGKIHPNDTFRIIRAIEVYETTGKTISEYHQKHRFSDEPFNVLKIGLHKEREILYDRINRRVDAMVEAGFVEEVKRLLDMGYTESLKSMQSIGYRHITEFIRGRLSYDEALDTLKRDTRRYSKRQMTWFKADPGIVWTEAGQSEDIRRLIDKHLKVRGHGRTQNAGHDPSERI